MRYTPDTRTFRGSATDLANHARCAHLTQRERERAVAIAEGREQVVARTGIALDRGREFEAAYVAERRAEVEAAGGRFLDVRAEAGGDARRGREVLAQAIRQGVELIAQAPLAAGDIFGYADLLERVEDAAASGGRLETAHRYEPVEVKYARSVRPEHVLQASAYAEAVGTLLGALPTRMHVVCGDRSRHTVLTSEYVDYFRAARGRFAEALVLDLQSELDRVPEPVGHCAGCDFRSVCAERWREVDHLSLVARIRTDQRAKLATVGVTTLTHLATTVLDTVPGIGRTTLAQLVAQAALQLAARELPLPGVEYRRPAEKELPGRGFAMLPTSDPADMFFDFEGYPYHESGALEYLWGWTSLDGAGQPHFDHLWADDVDAEGHAFSAFLDEVHARRGRSPGMHVFHYAPYEVTALRRLAKLYPHEMDRLDQLLRTGVFIDLYAVVRQALLVGTPSYSIKQLEPLYARDRSGDDLADGGESIEVYEQWLLGADPAVRAKIIDYNRVDCDSTLELREWLLLQRDIAREAGIEWPARVPDRDEANEAPEVEPQHPSIRLVERLEAVATDDAHPDDVRLAARLLSAMPGWGTRVNREFFGDLHARKHERDVEDYLRDAATIGGLELISVDLEPARAMQGTVERIYRFPAQAHMVDDGQDALDPSIVQVVGCVRELDPVARTLMIRTTAGQARKLDANGHRAIPHSILGWKDISVRSLEGAAADVAQRFLAALDAGRDPFNQVEPSAAALSLLARHAMRVSSGPGTEAVASPPDAAEIAALVRRAPGSHVIVQGPPGTGKTYTSARLITDLVAAGLRVGISSNSHAAVANVLAGIDRLDPALRAAYPLRTGEKTPGTLPFGAGWIERARKPEEAAALLAAGDVQVIAGTAWLFAREDVVVDVLLVDEAGQVSLLHATAMASAARTVVLVGDPQQLPQPASVMHPQGCGASVLEHLFEGAATLPPERAILLPVTRRMHPDVASFIGDAYYGGKLEAHPSTSSQYVDAPGLPRTGLHVLEVPHAGNRVRSDEEVEAIRAIVQRLLREGRVVPRPDEPERSIQPGDIIVVAPYNAQRRALRDELPDGIAVGTVDKFQGQEAPIAILSLTASSREELPRGLEFLLDPHRLNVAISRARALAIIAVSPALLATSAGSLHEMRLLNDLARLARVGRR